MPGSWASEFLLPIGVPSDYELGYDLPLVFPDMPDDDDMDEDQDQYHLLPLAA